MEKEEQKQIVEQKVNDLLAGNPTHFLVDIRIKPINNIKVFVDADEGINLSTLVNYNRSLYKVIEESGLFPADNFSLEVSSPGLDEPLKIHRQYKKNIGRYVEIVLNDETRREGKLIEATNDGIVLEFETGKGKQKQLQTQSILLENIKSAKVQVKFK